MGLWILLILLFLFLVLPLAVCLLPVYLRLYKDEEGNAKCTLKILCFPVSLEKKDKPKKDSEVLQQLGLSHYTSTGNLKKRISEKGLLTALKELTHIFKLLFSALGQAAKKFRVCRAKLTVVTAGEHAAMEYGAACALLYPLSAFLQSRSRVKSRSVDVDVSCDFEALEAEISYDLVLRIFVGDLIPIGWRILKTLWKENHTNEGK